MAAKRKKSSRKLRIIMVCIIFGLIFSLLIARLTKLQIIGNAYFSARAQQQQLDVAAIPASRGTIYDRNMTPLAKSAAAWDVVVSPSYVKNEAMRADIADNLSKILKLNRQAVLSQISRKTGYTVVAKKIDKTASDAITAYINKKKLGCVTLISDSERYYPYGDFLSQVLGFTGSDNQGICGLESEYDSVLKGIPGRTVVEKNALGSNMPYSYGEDIPAQDGNNLVLTVDKVVQHDLEDNLKQALSQNHVTNRVTGIVMDVNTGEILAMATEPGFDPNAPFTITDPTVKQQLASLSGTALKQRTGAAQQIQWRNKAITEPNEPGSTFKILTASMALEEGVVHENDPFYDPGSVKVADTTFHCWEPGGHGAENFLQGFENSCNVVFIQVGLRIGALNFFKYFSGFGLADKTGIDLPGEAGSIYIHEPDLGPVQLASCSFGQSNKLTPIQLITAVSAAANGGYLVQPHIVKQETDENGNIIKSFGKTVKRQVISAATSAQIDMMLEKEVEEGTGKNAYVAGYRVGGKTGTAQKLDSSDPNDCIASFVGVAPCDSPKVAVLFIMDDPHNTVSDFGGVIAAPVVGNLMSEILPYLGVEPQYTADELAKLSIKTPNMLGQAATSASTQLRSAGMQVTVIGSGGTVTNQTPSPQNPMPKNGRVVLYTGNAKAASTVKVPDLSGDTPSQASSALASLGLNVTFVGEDLNTSAVKAYEQDPVAGTNVPPGTVVTVKFRNEEIKVR